MKFLLMFQKQLPLFSNSRNQVLRYFIASINAEIPKLNLNFESDSCMPTLHGNNKMYYSANYDWI